MLRMQSSTLSLIALVSIAVTGCCLGGENVQYAPVPGFYPTAAALPAEVTPPRAGIPAAVRYAFAGAAPETVEAAARDHGKAFCWACMFPGGGYFYTGETTRGVIVAGIAGGSLLTGALLSSGSEYSEGGECIYNPETHTCVGGSGSYSSSDRTPLYIGAAVAAGAWAFGILDARRSVDRVNARSGVRVGALEAYPEPVLQLAREGAPSVGMQLRVSW